MPTTPRVLPALPALPALALAALALAGCGGAADASGPAADSVAVAATDSTCQVARTTLPAGTHRFEVTNRGARVTEFEVLGGGDRILAEAENISPGTSRTLLVDLPAGSYQAACRPGMVGSGIRSALTVSGGARSAAPDQRLADGATAYTGWVRGQVATLQQQTAAFAAAVKAGDVAKARALYPVARTSYERVEPVAESFGDLDAEIDARENDVEEGRPWTGFHVLEKALWSGDGRTGGDLAAAGPVADELVRDVGQLGTKVQTLELAPLDLANGALGLLDEIAKKKVTGEEDRYSHTDLWDVSANLEGSQQAVQSLRPVIADRDPALAAALDQQFAAARTALDRHRSGDGFVAYTDLTAEQTRGLSDAVNALAAQVSRVPAVIAQK